MQAKKYKILQEKIQMDKLYPLTEALRLVVENPSANFDESVDVAVNLGIDKGTKDQQIRGFTVLPHGLGRQRKVLVFAKAQDEEMAKQAGADFVGAEDLLEKIKTGWLGFDVALAAPDMMPLVSKIAKILGPKGLMPNPKMGTVTKKLDVAVKTEKKGKVSFRSDKNGIIHASVGRRSQGLECLKNNFLTFLRAVVKAKTSSGKGVYLKKLVLSSTMGPSIVTDTNDKALGL